MTTQQIQIAETIRGMKLALRRRADESDSDVPVQLSTNRGHKHERDARYVHHGRLDNTGGRAAYRRKVQHAGYTRYIISTNPTLYDADGDVVSPTDSDNEDQAEPIEGNVFGEVKLEELLRPLTAASELPDHPSLSLPYKSKALTRMVDEALEMVRREREILAKAKRLLRRFRGDVDWAPGEAFETDQDEALLLPSLNVAAEGDLAEEMLPQSAVPSIATDGQVVGEGQVEAANSNAMQAVEANGIDAMDMAMQQAAVEAEKTADQISQPPAAMAAQDNAPAEESNNDDLGLKDVPAHLENPTLDTLRNLVGDQEASSEQNSNSGKETNGTNVHAMTTRARARSPVNSAPASPTPSSSASEAAVNPWFLTPFSAQPDRDLGLPVSEAEDTRRMLLLYVQKQEHIVRQLEGLATGLLKADRKRRDIFRACKAEGHVRDDGKGNAVTEMSDGEDWYDPADWGLTERDLKMSKDGVMGLEKGRDEVEEVGEEEGRRGKRRRVVNRI